MYDLLLCHRRSPRTGRGAFRDHWRTWRAGLVASLQGDLGYDSYVQLHRASRLNVLYLGIKASRSWPVTALYSALQGLPAPPLRRRAGLPDERWDAVEMLRYSSSEALVAALTSAPARRAAQRLATDAVGFTRHSAAVIAEVLPVYRDASLGWPRTITLFCLRARPPMTRAEMLERWRTSHSELVQSLQTALEYRDYEQLHAGDAGAIITALYAFGVSAASFDGVASLSYGGQPELIAGLFSPATQIANLRLVRDEVNFIDGRNSALVFGEAERIVAARPS